MTWSFGPSLQNPTQTKDDGSFVLLHDLSAETKNKSFSPCFSPSEHCFYEVIVKQTPRNQQSHDTNQTSDLYTHPYGERQRDEHQNDGEDDQDPGTQTVVSFS